MKIAFSDVRKAYDRVWRDGLWQKNGGIQVCGEISVLKQLYKKGTCMVRFWEIEADWFEDVRCPNQHSRLLQ